MMLTKTVGSLGFALTCAVGTLFLGGAYASVDPPSTEFIAAALSKQANASVDVEYTLSFLKADGTISSRDAFKRHYIRTKDVIALWEADPRVQGSRSQCSYDAGSNEFRSMSERANYAPTGSIQTGLWSPLDQQDMVETARFAMPPVVTGKHPYLLMDVVKLGNVVQEMESIDGHPCWRVELLKPVKGAERYIIWLDPKIGFCPRRIDLCWCESDYRPAGTHTIRFLDYVEVSPGVWFHKKQNHSVPSSNKIAAYGITSEVTKLESGKTYAKQDLLVEFPSGARVSFGTVKAPSMIIP